MLRKTHICNWKENIRVPGNPTDISHASKLVVRVYIKDVFYSQGRTQEVATGCVYNALRLARRSGSLRSNTSQLITLIAITNQLT